MLSYNKGIAYLKILYNYKIITKVIKKISEFLKENTKGII